MKIVTTPMCEEIVKLAGISEYVVNKNPDEEEGDLAIVLSESKVEMKSLAIKINTPSQVFESIKKVSEIAENELSDKDVTAFFDDFEMCRKYLNSNFKRDINVKVYSNFLKDIVLDMGFNIVSQNFDYVIYPDYLKDQVIETENLSDGVEIIQPSSLIEDFFEGIKNDFVEGLFDIN